MFLLVSQTQFLDFIHFGGNQHQNTELRLDLFGQCTCFSASSEEDEDLDLQPTLFQQWMGDLKGDESSSDRIVRQKRHVPVDV